MTRNRYELLGCNIDVFPRGNDFRLAVGYSPERTMELAKYTFTDFTVKDGFLFNIKGDFYFMAQPDIQGCGYTSFILIRLLPCREDIKSNKKISLERVRAGFNLALKEGRKIIDEQLDYFQDRDCLRCN